MSDGGLQLALREWRALFLNPIGLVVQACVGVVLGVSGPFGTQDTVLFLPRILYWVWVVYSTYGLGLLGFVFLSRLLESRAIWIQTLVTGCVNGVTISLYVTSMNFLIFGPGFMMYGPVTFISRVFLIGFFVTAAASTISRIVYGRQDAPKAEAKTAQVPLLDRLPIEKRGDLMALSVEDHYVRVRTTTGVSMILMRLSDAIREAGDAPGAQVHRSHWVSFGHVSATRREGDRAILTLTDSTEIPVSRANLPKIREAGLLPR